MNTARFPPSRWPVLMFVAVLVVACASLPPPLNNRPGDPTPVIQCSPPPCAADETYACGSASGDCPGGCGTICVKITPPAATPVGSAGALVCPLVVRTPAPEAPTASANGTAVPDDQVDPHVALCATSTQVAVGDTVTLTARAVDIGLPIFQVSARPGGAADFVPLVQVEYDGQVKNLSVDPIGTAFVYSSAQASSGELTLALIAIAPGTLDLVIGATGEIHYGYPGPATWGGGGSEVLVLTAVGP